MGKVDKYSLELYLDIINRHIIFVCAIHEIFNPQI